jgi:nucleotide-binding universal stress UspA family protein
MREQAEAELARTAARHSGEFDVFVEVRDQTPIASAVRDAALDLDAAAIVVGSSHRGRAGRMLAGDVAASLRQTAPCPVVVAPRDYVEPAEGLARIGVAFADTPEGREALSLGATLTRRCHGTLSTYTVMEPGERSAQMQPGRISARPYDDARRHAEVMADTVASLLPYGMRASWRPLTGPPSIALGEASRDVDILVCGSRARSALGAMAPQSVSRGLIKSAACPLLVVPRASSRRLSQRLSRREGVLAA